MTRTCLALALVVSTGCAMATTAPGVQSPTAVEPTGPTLFRVILPVRDLEEAARFYAQVLESPGVRVSDGRHYFHCGETILACFDPRADGDGYDATPLPEWIYFAVDDLEATYERCRAAAATFEPGAVGGPPAGEIARRPWGELSFYARDPSGNGICFVDRATMFTGES